jgi:uncharacterized protein YxeA
MRGLIHLLLIIAITVAAGFLKGAELGRLQQVIKQTDDKRRTK